MLFYHIPRGLSIVLKAFFKVFSLTRTGDCDRIINHYKEKELLKMPYFYLVASAFFCASASIFGSFFNVKNASRKDPTALYNLFFALSAFVGWGVLYGFDFSFNPKSLIYALLFAAFYAVAIFGLLKALETGPVSLTSLILQLSLIGVTAWGFFFWDVPFTWIVGVGISLVAVAIVLCLAVPRKEGSDKKPITLRWLIYAAMAFFGNAACTIVQKTHQMDFEGNHGNMLMFFSMAMVTLMFFVLYLRSDKRDSREILKRSLLYPVLAGVCNVFLNLFIIILAGYPVEVPPSLLYPVISIGGIILTSLFSAIFLKEKLYPWQWAGIAIGGVAIALLSSGNEIIEFIKGAI